MRKSRSSIFCFSCTSSCSFVERVKEKMWMVAVAFLIQSITFLDQGSDNGYLTRKMIIGDMMRTRRRIAIPNACCWFAVFNSLSTVSLKRKIIQKPSWFYFSKLTQVVFSVLSKRSSASLYSRMWQHSTGTGFSVQQGLHHIVENSPQKLRLRLDFSSFDLARLLWMTKVFFDLIQVDVSPACFYQREICLLLYLFIVFPNLLINEDLIFIEDLKPAGQSSCSGPSTQTQECRAGWTAKSNLKSQRKRVWKDWREDCLHGTSIVVAVFVISLVDQVQCVAFH